jgi:sec-independent protein translocase protein TatB
VTAGDSSPESRIRPLLERLPDGVPAPFDTEAT